MQLLNPLLQRTAAVTTPSATLTRHMHPNRRHSASALMAFVLTLLSCPGSIAQQSAAVPSHCTADEFALINAKMFAIHNFREPTGGWRKGDTVYELRTTGKVLSICSDSPAEPLHSVTYRFGPIGKIEMERVATASQQFHFFDRSTSPHTGENIIFFNVGSYTCCVSEATAQGSGIGLTVLKSGRKVLALFSGNERGIDFESRTMEVIFSSALSTVFQPFEPLKPSQTPCDPRPTK